MTGLTCLEQTERNQLRAKQDASFAGQSRNLRGRSWGIYWAGLNGTGKKCLDSQYIVKLTMDFADKLLRER